MTQYISHCYVYVFPCLYTTAADVFRLSALPKNAKKDLTIFASFFEIYNGKVYDLLDKKVRLRILKDVKIQVQVIPMRIAYAYSSWALALQLSVHCYQLISQISQLGRITCACSYSELSRELIDCSWTVVRLVSQGSSHKHLTVNKMGTNGFKCFVGTCSQSCDFCLNSLLCSSASCD